MKQNKGYREWEITPVVTLNARDTQFVLRSVGERKEAEPFVRHLGGHRIAFNVKKRPYKDRCHKR